MEDNDGTEVVVGGGGDEARVDGSQFLAHLTKEDSGRHRGKNAKGTHPVGRSPARGVAHDATKPIGMQAKPATTAAITWEVHVDGRRFHALAIMCGDLILFPMRKSLWVRSLGGSVYY